MIEDDDDDDDDDNTDEVWVSVTFGGSGNGLVIAQKSVRDLAGVEAGGLVDIEIGDGTEVITRALHLAPKELVSEMKRNAAKVGPVVFLGALEFHYLGVVPGTKGRIRKSSNVMECP